MVFHTKHLYNVEMSIQMSVVGFQWRSSSATCLSPLRFNGKLTELVRCHGPTVIGICCGAP